MPGIVKTIETRFLEDDVVDGDYPRDDTREDVAECDDAAEAARLIMSMGLSFAASGTDWAADPDGSRTVDYRTGMRAEISAHLSGWTDAETAEIIAAVG